MNASTQGIVILATGDEIIHGDTLNTNSHTIAKSLCTEGFSMSYHLACGDKESEIVHGLDFLSKRSNVLIILGGLGPTSDDRTRFAVARFLNLTLVERDEAIAHIRSRIQRANLSMSEENRQQSLFPAHATLLPNPYGTAMGCYFSLNKKIFILLPGPPQECLPMFHECVLPFLQKKSPHSHKQMLKWRLFGLAESEIASKLDEALQHIPCKTAYRLETPYIEFKVSCSPTDVQQVEQIINPIVTPHIIAPPDEKASARLRQLLETLSEPILIIDEATGGRLQTLIQHPKNNNNVYFHEKEEPVQLRFYIDGLKEYWTQKTAPVTHLIIKYQTEGEHGSETHEIPYRSSFVLSYAVEWLSFRLFQLINQLH